ncbi:MAG: zonular occludens toxin domain-containing protein [Planctomycetota bacterium]
MRNLAVTTVLTAPAGTGKSYMTVNDIVYDFLPNGGGNLWCNLPLGAVPATHSTPPAFEGETFAERIGDFVAKGDADQAAAYAARIKMIDDEALSRWREKAVEGPWDYFRDVDLTGAWIVIDEAHNYASTQDPIEKKKHWQTFCGELRHRGARILFITQSPNKLARQIMDEAGLRQSLIDARTERDPFFGIPLYYWYELRAKAVGKYEAAFARRDHRDNDGKKTKVDHTEWVQRDPAIFALYDSFAAPQAGGQAAGADAALGEWEKRTWPSLLWWFLRCNFMEVMKPALYGVIILVALWNFKPITQYVMTRLSNAAKAGAPTAGEVRQSLKPASETPTLASGAAVPPSISEEELRRVESLRRRNAELEARLVQAEEALRQRSAVVAITPEAVTFSDGRTYRTGQQIWGGPFDGRRIQEVDFDMRWVVLDDDRRLFLGAGAPDGISTADDGPSELGTSVLDRESAIGPARFARDDLR